MSEFEQEVILGVDTHLDTHVGVVVDDLGRARGTLVVPTTPAGSEQLLAWARSLGVLKRAGVEGTGTYGAGLARARTRASVQVIEVNRPDRSRLAGSIVGWSGSECLPCSLAFSFCHRTETDLVYCALQAGDSRWHHNQLSLGPTLAAHRSAALFEQQRW